MGTCDFGNAYNLWLVKTGKKPPFAGNEFTQRGVDAEPIIKDFYENEFGIKLDSPVLEWNEWPILSASLDGYNKERGILCEFKYPSSKKHELALSGVIPLTYVDQLQTQMLVTGLDQMDYVSYDGKGICVVKVKADKDRQLEIIEKCKSFWHCVVNDIEPPTKFVKVLDSDLEAMASRFMVIYDSKKEIEDELNSLKKSMINKISHTHASFYGLLLSTDKRGIVSIRKGG